MTSVQHVAGSGTDQKGDTILTPGFAAVCAVTLVGTTAVCQFFVLPLLLAQVNVTESMVGLIMGAYFAGALIGIRPAAGLTRALGARRTIQVGLLVLAVCPIALWVSPLPQVTAILRLIQGFSWSLLLIPLSLQAVEAAPAARLTQTLAIHGSCFLIGQAAGPWIGTLLLGQSALLFFCAASFPVLACLALVRFLPEIRPRLVERHSTLKVPGNSAVLPLITNALLILGFGMSASFVADLATSVGLQRAVPSFFLAWTGGGLAVRFLGGPLMNRGSHVGIALVGGAACALGLSALCFLTDSWQLWFSGFCIGTGTSVYSPVLLASVVERSSDRLVGVRAFRETSMASMAAASFVGGLLASWIGFPSIFGLALATTVAGCMAALGLRESKRVT